ncbi:hypothetical protein Plec18167_004762 [Paecilomyces lecythidis]|uniref:Uncharacterized protein n=1 Tax=Paecilomyces lecythidis TaxID=3004212 RepID=A0ABR3XP83_9EURO
MQQLDGQRRLYDSGKVIGGSSARNFLWQIRGSEGCFDKWADVVGDDSYKFHNFLQYFQRSMHFNQPDQSLRPQNASASYNISDWNSHGEPIQVGYSSWVNPISSWLGLGFEELGLKPISSFLGGSLFGWSWMSLTLDPRTQTRSSSMEFLKKSLMETTNLYIYKSTLAKSIVFENGTARSVTVESGGRSYNLTARKEVILSAGVMRSPQLLMVSGVGPKDTLEALGIEVIADRPGVGQNMWDNVLVGPTYQVNVITHNSIANAAYLAEAVEEYNINRTGILTNVGGDVTAFERLPTSALSDETSQALNDSFPSDWPHIQYLILDAYFGTGADSTNGLFNDKQYVSASVGLVSTFSRGNVTISSNDTSINPVISPNWLLDARDQEVAIAAFRRGRALFSTDAIKPVVIKEAYPGENYTTDEQILEIVRESANSVYNAAGTNKMGKLDDTAAVVDSNGRVIGVNNLRVVDASIFPFLPPGQPSATVYALAEKIAEGILREN